MAQSLEKSKGIHLVNELLGYESKEFPSEVNEKRASYMKNMLPCDGLNKKRKGWREIYSFRDENDAPLRVNGIFEYGNILIVHAGEHLFKCDAECKKIASDIALANENSCAFENNGLLYIVSGTELYVFDGTALVNAFESKYAYIPTTRTDIREISGEQAFKENEGGNALTSKRINTLIGTAKEGAKYELDGYVDFSREITVRSQFSVALSPIGGNEAPYFAYHKKAKRLLIDDVEGIGGYLNTEAIEGLLSGEGIAYNLAEVEEVVLFLKQPMKIESVVLEASLGNTVPRVAFLLGTDVIYDTQATSEYKALDLTSSLYGQVFDTLCLYGNHDKGIIESIELMGKAGYEGRVEITHKSKGASYNQIIKPTLILSEEGEEITLCKNKTGSHIFTPSIWFERGLESTVLALSYNSIGQIKDRSNIEITFYEENFEKPKFYIGGTGKTNTGAGIIALSTDNSCIYVSSAREGFGYLPANLMVRLGSYGKISAICQMADLTLAVYKENEAYNLVIDDKNGELTINVSGYSSGLGSLSHFATLCVNNDTLCPTRRGIFGSVVYERNGFFERSSAIARELIKHDLRKALAIENNGCYYLFVDGKALVADTRQRVGSAKDSFEYEWWLLDNCPASCLGTRDNELLMGREDGKIVAFYDGYRDIYYDTLQSGDFLIKKDANDNDIIYLNALLGLKADDTIVMNNGYCHLSDINEAALNERGNLKVYLPFDSFWNTWGNIKFYPNMKLYLLGENGGFIEAVVKEVFPYECSLVFDLQENNDTYLCLVRKNENSPYALLENDDHFYLINEHGARAVLYETEKSTLRCERGKNVECEIISSAIAPLGYFKSKTLYKLCFNLISESGGEIELGYETDRGATNKHWAMEAGLNFDKLDFNSISLRSDFSKSYTLRCFERDFKYLIFKIKHKENQCLTFKSVAIYYEENEI